MTATPLVGSTFFGLDISQLATRLLAIRRRISKRVLVLEFGSDVLLLAEATLTQSGVQLSHVSSFALPPEALDRGVPAEPLKMARFIQDFCSEKKIPAHRVAVVLPPELAFQRVLDLPASLTTDEARDYVLNPANGIQIPFPLTQTDFDLCPVSTPQKQPRSGDQRSYMLTAIPEVLVDPIVEMLQAADLELQLLELGSHSQLRIHAADLITLAPQQVDVVLELRPECSNLMLVSCSGLLSSERLAAIRNLPELDLEPDQLSAAIESGFSAEDLLLKDEGYLPLSELDLRVLVSDLQASLERFQHTLPDAVIQRVILTGVNSAHPRLAELMGEMLDLPVALACTSAIQGLAGLSLDGLLLRSGLDRLIGLALGLLPDEQLLACSVDSPDLDVQGPHHLNDVVTMIDPVGSPDPLMGVALEAVKENGGLLTDEKKVDVDIIDLDVEVDDLVPLEPSASLYVESPIHRAEDLLTPPAEAAQYEALPGSLSEPSSLEQKPLDIVIEEMPSGSASSQDFYASTNDTEHPVDQSVSDQFNISDDQWPSINDHGSDAAEQISFDVDDIADSGESTPDVEWPSIASPQQDNQPLDQVTESEDDASTWPSISFDGSQELDPKSESNIDKIDASDLPFLGFSGESPALPAKLTSDQDEKRLIPDLIVSERKLDKESEAMNEETVVPDSESPDPLQGLGELRFAEDD